MRSSVLVSVMVLEVGVLGCRPPQPVEPTPPAADESAPAMDGTTVPADEPVQPGQPGPGAPGSATPIAPAAVATTFAVLTGIAETEAPGAKPDGGPFGGQFEVGQTLELLVNVQAGKCYTVVAVGMGIVQLDIQLVMQSPPMPPMIVAQSNTSGAAATLGGKDAGCWKNPSPLSGPGTVILRATRGAGIAGAQVYVK